MGDHRADVKITFDFHGKKYEYDAWINYQGYDGVDQRIIEFFENSWSDGMSRYNERHRKAREKREK